MGQTKQDVREALIDARSELSRFGNYGLVVLGGLLVGVISRDFSGQPEFQGAWWIIASVASFLLVYFSRVMRCIVELRYLSKLLASFDDYSEADRWFDYRKRVPGRDKLWLWFGWNSVAIYGYLLLGFIVLGFACLVELFPARPI